MKKPNLARGELARLACAVVAVGLVIAMLIIIPLGPRKQYEQSHAEVVELRTQLGMALEAKEAELERLRSQEKLMAKLNERKPNFDLWSFMNTVLKQTKLAERAYLENFKPRTDRQGAAGDVVMVQLRLNGASLEELVDLLHKIYASGNLVVMHKLDFLRPGRNNKGLDCNIVFLSPKA